MFRAVWDTMKILLRKRKVVYEENNKLYWWLYNDNQNQNTKQTSVATWANRNKNKRNTASQTRWTTWRRLLPRTWSLLLWQSGSAWGRSLPAYRQWPTSPNRRQKWNKKDWKITTAYDANETRNHWSQGNLKTASARLKTKRTNSRHDKLTASFREDSPHFFIIEKWR